LTQIKAAVTATPTVPATKRSGKEVMSEIIIHTYAFSPYGWTARHVAAEKGVSQTMIVADPTSAEHRNLHPFGKVPVLQHGDIFVYETLAIAHYIDCAFPGPALQPADCLGQTRMLRWISVISSYVFPVLNSLIKERTAGSWRPEPTDEAVIAALRPPLAHGLGVIEETLSSQPFLAGRALTLADSFLMPILHLGAFTPEGEQALAEAPATRAWLERLRSRPSFTPTEPFAVMAGSTTDAARL
jgi:glutathione S-transferase